MLRLLVERVEDYAIFLLDVEGHVATWNPGARRIKGYEADQIIGKHFSVFYPQPERDAEKPQRELEVAIATGKYEEEGWRVRSDGRLFWASILITPLFDETGELRGFAKITRDMTAHKRAEERLQSALRDAEAASRMKDEFLTTISHELRTPLTSILGWATLLQIGERDPESLEVAIQSIEQSAKLQARLVEDLLDVSRLTAGALNVSFAEVELDRLILRAIDSIRPTAQAKGVAIHHDLCPERIVVSGDEARLHQVCWNVLSNAVKFTAPGGEIRLRCVPGETAVTIEVRDTGRGIAPEFLPRVFERFSQADGSATRSDAGLGLGLAIAKQIVEVHGGTITAESEGPDRGATFRVDLPILARSPRAARTEPPLVTKLPSLRGLHILVLEDDLHARTFLKALVEQCGAEVTPAGSVAEAILQLQQRTPDAVISDIAMPGEDGFAFIRQLRSVAPDLPAVAVTAVYVAPDDRDRLLQAGFDEYLRKPVLPAELADRIRLLVLHKRG